MTWNPEYDGLSLKGGPISVRPSGVKDSGPVKVSTKDLLRGGSAVDSVRVTGRVIEVEGDVADSTANWEATIDGLFKVLQQTEKKVLRLSDDRYIDACAVPEDLRPQGVTGGSKPAAKWGAKFIATEPYWRSQSQTTDTTTNTATSVTDTLTNGGNAPEYPTFELENTGGSTKTGLTVTIRNQTTSKEFRLFDFDLAAGDTLIVDTTNGQVYIESPAGSASNAPKRIDGAWIALEEGANTIEYEANDSSGGITYRAKHYARYRTFGDFSP